MNLVAPYTAGEVMLIEAEIPQLIQPERSILRWLATWHGLTAELATARRQLLEQIADKHRILQEYDATVKSLCKERTELQRQLNDLRHELRGSKA